MHTCCNILQTGECHVCGTETVNGMQAAQRRRSARRGQLQYAPGCQLRPARRIQLQYALGRPQLHCHMIQTCVEADRSMTLGPRGCASRAPSPFTDQEQEDFMQVHTISMNIPDYVRKSSQLPDTALCRLSLICAAEKLCSLVALTKPMLT